ncbi:MAG: adenylate/guanylate cyclase domain-containing protein [Loktanella sp.]|nr:adenylate/guanylate cyclase domain-containing protein [Loktanella sp.]
MRLALWTWIWASVVALCAATVMLVEPLPYRMIRDLAGDAVQRLHPRPYDPAAPVAIVDVDEASLAAFGQWPWPRTLLAALTGRLYQHGAIAVGFDVIFPEADRTSPEQVALTWRRFGGPDAPQPGLDGYPSHDAQFAQAIAAGPTVLSLAGAGAGAVPPLPAGVAVTGDWPAALTRFGGALTNLPQLDAAASGLGAISLIASTDGIVRTVPLVIGTGDQLVPSFPLELLRVAQGARGHILRTSQASGEISGGTAAAVALRTGAIEVPVEANGHFRVHFAGFRPERVTPVTQVMQSGDFDPALADRIAGRIVMIGASAQGLFDIRATPLEPAVPGVTVHAEVLEQIIAGHYLTRPDWLKGLEVLLALLGAGVVALALGRNQPLWALAGSLAVFGGAAAAAPVLFASRAVVFDPVAIALVPFAVFLPGAAAGLWAKERARRAIRARFAHFVPADLLPQIEANPERALTPRGAERTLTVIFIDMRGFSTASEGMPPEHVVTLVNAFLSAVSAVLVTHRATIDKYMGDAIMGFWNAPIEQPDHMTRAINALPAILAAAHSASDQMQAQGLPPISVGIGLNTGPAAIGLMGSQARLSYTCLGETVNLAARLEGLTRLYGVWNCVGPTTAAQCPQGFVAVGLDLISVKGFRRAVEVSTLLADDTNGLDDLRRILAQARLAYGQRDWDSAAAAFGQLETLTLPDCDPAALAQLYLRRIADWRRNPPPPDWDASHAALAK